MGHKVWTSTSVEYEQETFWLLSECAVALCHSPTVLLNTDKLLNPCWGDFCLNPPKALGNVFKVELKVADVFVQPNGFCKD